MPCCLKDIKARLVIILFALNVSLGKMWLLGKRAINKMLPD